MHHFNSLPYLMQDLKQREEKMKEKRKHTPWRAFVQEICSWMPINIYKHDFWLSRFPSLERAGNLMSPEEFNEKGINTMYTQDFDITTWFFTAFGEFYKNHPKSSLSKTRDNENSKYADSLFGAKNAYLSFATGDDAENIIYSFTTYAKVSNILNSVSVIDGCENIFYCTDITKSFNIFYSRFIINSNNIRFSTNMIWCNECIECDGLDNKSYCIRNEKLPKDEYFREKQKILAQKDTFTEKYNKNIKIIGSNINSHNVSWQRVIFSENIESWYLVSYMKDARNVYLTAWVNGCTNFYDCFEVWFDSHDMYAVSQGWTYSQNVYCSNFIDGWANQYYSFFLEQCSYCLGCIGLKNKEFCILNKQYTKEEWFEMANKIFEQMDKDWTLWQFFPWSINPFYFNDTVASLIDDSFTKEEVAKEWYLRRDEEIKVDTPAWAEVITTKELNNFQWFNEKGEREINPEILKKVIKDEKWNYYRIIPMELEFLQKHGLPLPEIHWLDRIKLGFKFK